MHRTYGMKFGNMASTEIYMYSIPVLSKLPNSCTSHPFRGLAQKQLLYCRVGIGYHLQILPNGNIGGVHEPTEYCRFCWLKVFSMQWGVVGIKGLKSNLYLCMSSAGIAWGSEHFMAECLFREDMEEDHYTTYASASHPGLYLALSHNGQAKRGNTVQKENPCAHFLPQVDSLPKPCRKLLNLNSFHKIRL
uniref:Fibroblast growth factor n=1 Tax=Paramormyrops kingsleyae TaxID=1676925 RepID=A0A3B3RHP5_9TELE